MLVFLCQNHHDRLLQYWTNPTEGKEELFYATIRVLSWKTDWWVALSDFFGIVIEFSRFIIWCHNTLVAWEFFFFLWEMTYDLWHDNREHGRTKGLAAFEAQVYQNTAVTKKGITCLFTFPRRPSFGCRNLRRAISQSKRPANVLVVIIICRKICFVHKIFVVYDNQKTYFTMKISRYIMVVHVLHNT